jgi:type IV secretory pathway VirB9-like protein
MEFIKAYVYATEQEAQFAIEQINQALGIPVSPDAVTQTYTNYENINGTWLIRHDETIETILGQPIDFEYNDTTPEI